MFCALAWVMANYWLNIGKIDPVIYRDITGLCLAGVLGASWIDTKKPANPDGRILDDANKGG